MTEPRTSAAAQVEFAQPARLQAAVPPTMVSTRPGHRTRYWLAGLLALAVMVAAGLAWRTHFGGTPVTYTTAAVSKGPVTRMVTTTGTVNPELTVIVGSYVSGVIQQLFCDYNTKVKTGQVCAKIDPRPYQSAVDQARATLAISKAQLQKDQASLTYAKQALDRNANLVQSRAVSLDAYDNAKNAYDQAVAQVAFDEATIDQRQAALAAAQVNLDYTSIVSPVDGTVVSRNVTMGQTVAASFQTPTLFLIASDLTKMQVDTNVSEGDIGGIKQGARVLFSVDAYPDRTFEGTVTQVRQSPQTVQNVVTYDVVVGVSNLDLALMPGMTAAARIITDQRADVVRVPASSLRYVPRAKGALGGPKAPHVWVLRDGSPVAVQIKPGLSDDNVTEIIAGDLKPTDQVIVGEQTVKTGLPAPRSSL
jgi:HlyD family secretion protein